MKLESAFLVFSPYAMSIGMVCSYKKWKEKLFVFLLSSVMLPYLNVSLPLWKPLRGLLPGSDVSSAVRSSSLLFWHIVMVPVQLSHLYSLYPWLRDHLQAQPICSSLVNESFYLPKSFSRKPTFIIDKWLGP